VGIYKVGWGAGFANEVLPAYPLLNAKVWSADAPGSEHVVLPSGEEDVWLTGTHEFVGGDVGWIEPVGSGGVTGWEGATGWKAFLAWARQSNVVRFYPDRDTPLTYVDAYLVEPRQGEPQKGEDFLYSFRLVLRSSDGTPFEGIE